MKIKIRRKRSTEETRKLKLQRIVGAIVITTSLMPAIISAVTHSYCAQMGASLVYALIGCPLLFSKNIII